jgi:HTH-type transcriptional repressor of NAD biosynthesis genes
MEFLEMEKKYNKALVIGKFMPLHKGHIALINFACQHANTTIVCALAHDDEPISLDQRVEWLKQTSFSGSVEVRGLSFDAQNLNPSSQSDRQSAMDWVDFLQNQLQDFNEIDVFVGSELYVKYMADYIGIQYIIFDEQRVQVSISATAIKNDPIKYWDYLAPAVKRTYVMHICICGSESTGKTTVSKTLEQKYDCVTLIPEIGRCIVGKSELCTIEQLCRIYDIHHQLLEAVIYDPPTPIVLWDTDNLTTLSYFNFLFPNCSSDIIIKNRPYLLASKYFFFESNIDFVDDNTRLAEDAAYALRNNHIQIYQQAGVELEFVTENRLQLVDRFISRLVKQLSKL